MIVSDTRQFIFIHNPKCAGTTVRRALMPFDTTGDFFWMFHEIEGRQLDKAHLPLSLLKAYFPEYFERLTSHFVFMFVRDPYARAISAFNEARSRIVSEADPAREIVENRDAYVAALNDFIGRLTPEKLDGWGTDYSHFIRQRDMAYLGAKLMVDCVMQSENLVATSAKLDVFDPELRVRLLDAPRYNVRTVPEEPESLLSRESIATINAIYRDDFLLFDYPTL